MKFKFLFTALAVICYTFTWAQTEVSVYDFEGLTANSPLNGQDSWDLAFIGPYTNNINAQRVVDTGFDGLAFRGASNGGNRQLSVTRVNNADFSFQNLGCKERIVLEWDHDVNFWSSGFQLGYDANNDGDLHESNELSFGLDIGRKSVNTNPYRVRLIRADGSQVAQNAPLAYSGYSWYRFRIDIDMTANGGQGAGTVSYRDLNNGGSWITLSALTNINMAFNDLASDATNPTNLNGYAYNQAADATSLDNITITTDEGPDTDGDGEADVCDADDDNDGVVDTADSHPLDRYRCQDEDGDSCDDCASGTVDAYNDGIDTDADGICNDSDPDDDGDGCPDEVDAYPLIASTDTDCDGTADDCDVCPGGDDSVDQNGDGIPDCSQLLDYNDYAADWQCAKNKLSLCHVDEDGLRHEICINKNALAAHLAHGDWAGPCQSCGEKNLGSDASTGKLIFTEFGLSLYPNPASSQVKIVLNEAVEAPASLQIFDLLGREVWQQKVAAGTHSLNLDLSTTRFANGAYWLRVQSGQTQSVTAKLLINR